MRRPRPHHHIIPHSGIHIPPALQPRRMEPHRALRDQEALIVHLVPVGRGPGEAGRDGEFGGAEAVVGVGAVFHDAQGEGGAEADDVAGFGGDEVDGDLGDGEACGGVFAGCHVFCSFSLSEFEWMKAWVSVFGGIFFF